jgi:hypothetical protein
MIHEGPFFPWAPKMKSKKMKSKKMESKKRRKRKDNWEKAEKKRINMA